MLATKHTLSGRFVRAPRPERLEIFSIECEDNDKWRHFLSVERELSIWPRVAESIAQPPGLFERAEGQTFVIGGRMP